MAPLRLLRAPAWQHRCSRPCWTPVPSPGRGCRRLHRPSEGHSAQLLLQPPSPSLNRYRLHYRHIWVSLVKSTRVRFCLGTLPARVTPAAVPRVPPLPGGSPWGERGGQAALSRSFYIPEPLRLCLPPPPPGDTWGEGSSRRRAQSCSAGRARAGGGGSAASSPPPPLPRAGRCVWAHLPPADGGTGGAISHKGGH